MIKQLLKSISSSRGKTKDFSEKQTEGKLKVSELRYRRLFETAQDGILILNTATGKIDDANPFLEKLLGYSLPELLGKELWEIGAFKDKVAFKQLQEKGYIRYKDLPLQTKDGKIIDVEFISNVYKVGDERVIQCNIRDITERKRAEEAVELRTRELEEMGRSQQDTKTAMLNVMEDLEEAKAIIELEKVKDEAMLSSIGEGLIAVDNERKIMIINKAAESILGWKLEELKDKEITMLSLEDEEGRRAVLDQCPATIALSRGGIMTNNNYFYVAKDGTKLPLAINVTPIQLGDKTLGAIIIFRDITRELEIDKAKSEFVSIASHQLRTPLGIIKWYLEALEKEEYLKKAPEVVRNYFEEISKSNERVLSLVRDLLSVSRIEQGRVKNVTKSVELIDQISEIVTQMQIAARKKKIGLKLSLPERKIKPVRIDVLRFHEVIENLVNNAIEYTESGGTIQVSISLDKTGNILSVSVKDTGIGMSVRDKEKLFTKFFRAENAVGHNPEGTGLGLYVVKSYVEGWGGNVSAVSAEGKGSTFTISLPISQNKKKLVPPSLTDKSRSKKVKVYPAEFQAGQ